MAAPNTPIGTCSLCGGPVVRNSQHVEPVPTCTRCGAVAKEPFGPTIQMTNPKAPWPPEMSTADFIEWQGKQKLDSSQLRGRKQGDGKV